MSFWHVLTLVLVVLKATGYFEYSWVVVFTPVMLRYLLTALAFLLLAKLKIPANVLDKLGK